MGSIGAVVLTGGTAARLGGVDKAALVYEGRTLLDRALAAVADADAVVVVGPPVATAPRGRAPVRFVREDPPGGGPAAGLLAGCDALPDGVTSVMVLAVDMPHVTAATFRRLRAAAAGRDGAFLVQPGPGGRRQLAGVLDLAALARARPAAAAEHGLAVHRLLAPLDLADVAATADEAHDVDTWADARGSTASAGRGLRASRLTRESGSVNLHDWIDELCDELDVSTEVDEALVLDLARVAAHQVERTAAPVTTYLVGFAAGAQGADPARIEALAAKAQALAERWDRPAGAPDPDDVETSIPDDSAVDHSTDSFED